MPYKVNRVNKSSPKLARHHNLHFLFQFVLKYTAEFLYVTLQERVQGLPSNGLGELRGAYRRVEDEFKAYLKMAMMLEAYLPTG